MIVQGRKARERVRVTLRVRELEFVCKMRAGVGGRGGESGNEGAE